MTIELTKKVRYEASERLDLNDKLAEDSLLDETLAQYNEALLTGVSAPDGRVFRGWTTPTTIGPNLGLSLPAETSIAVDRSGLVVLRDGTAGYSLTLVTNAINYIYAYYDEAESDVDNRRKYVAGVEVNDSFPTRFTRTSGIHKTTTGYGTGVPDFADFAKTATILGIIRQLIPLYAVAVDAGDNITRIDDFRPLWTPGQSGAGGADYDTAAEPDFPHNFSPTDAPTLGIVDVRSALVAITDRLLQLKGTTNWWDDVHQSLESVSDEWKRSGANLYRVSDYVGIGVDPSYLLDLENANATIRLRATGAGPTTAFTINTDAGGATTIAAASENASSLSINFDCLPPATQAANYFFFRNTNTSGIKRVRFLQGSGSFVADAQIGVDGTDSYFQLNGGNVGIGYNTPAHSLDVFPVGAPSVRIASQTTATGAVLSLGLGTSGNRQVSLNLVGDDTYSTYGLQLVRGSAGANATSSLKHRGTGDLQLYHEDVGDVTMVFPFSTIRFDVQTTATSNLSLVMTDTMSRIDQLTTTRRLSLALNGTEKLKLETTGEITLVPSTTVTISGDLNVNAITSSSEDTDYLQVVASTTLPIAKFDQNSTGNVVRIIGNSATAKLLYLEQPENTIVFQVLGSGATTCGDLSAQNATVNGELNVVTAPVSLPLASSDPGSPANGDLYVNSVTDQMCHYSAVLGRYQAADSLIYAKGGGVSTPIEISDSVTTEQTFSDGGTIQATIAANTLRVGSVIKFSCICSGTSMSTSGITLYLRVGNTTSALADRLILSTFSRSMGGSPVYVIWEGTIIISGLGDDYDSIFYAGSHLFSSSSVTTGGNVRAYEGTVDAETTSSMYVTPTVTWGTSGLGNKLKLLAFTVSVQ